MVLATPHSAATPYAALSPQTVLEAVEQHGLLCSGHLLALNSYENRVYEVKLEKPAPWGSERLVVKFYRPHRWNRNQILEEHTFAAQLAEAEVDVVPPLAINGKTLFEHAGYLYCLYPHRPGRPIELRGDEDFRQMGRLVARIHAVGAQQDFVHRMALTPKSYGWDNLVFLRKSGFIPADLIAAYDATVNQLLGHIDGIWGNRRFDLRIHGDCHLGNILRHTDVFFVDLDDSLSGPAVQDLWMFTSGESHTTAHQMGLLLEGYTQIRSFDYSELQLAESLRALRMIHYTAWLARRWEDPTFPQSFPFFTTADYWQKHLLALKEQLPLLHQPLLVQV